jgi:hypothetical protein
MKLSIIHYIMTSIDTNKMVRPGIRAADMAPEAGWEMSIIRKASIQLAWHPAGG